MPKRLTDPRISRRPFLKSAAGIGLFPWMESWFAGDLLSAAETRPRPPVRFVTLFFPNGVYPAAWQVESEGNQLHFDASLQPLQPWAGEATVITGLNNPLGGHLGQTSGFLSGVDFETVEGNVRGATSLDQLIAQRFAADTFIPSLNLALEPPSQGGFGNRPRSFGNSISWSSPDSKIEPQINPQQAFDQVFFGQSEAGRRVAGRRKRIVDAIWQEAESFRTRVSSADRQKLSQYLDSISAVEKKIQKSLSPVPREWKPPNARQPVRPEQSGIPTSHPEHLRMMMEIMLLALQTDSTRVATLVLGHSISRIVYDFVDKKLNRNHHDYSHHRNDDEKIKGYNQITSWLSQQCGWFLDQMAGISEGNGSLLDNSLVLYGSGMKDGNVHEPNDVPIALFGRAGGKLQGGRLIECPEGSTLAQLHLSLLHVFGIEADDFNGVTSKPLEELRS